MLRRMPPTGPTTASPDPAAPDTLPAGPARGSVSRSVLRVLPVRGGTAQGRPLRGLAVKGLAVKGLAVKGLVLAMVTGATTAFAVLHTEVTVDVDGTPVQVTGFGRTVGDVLADAGIDVGERDLVAPALDEPVVDGGEIVVRHGRALEVEIDGRTRTVWTTALTVGEAMADLGVRGDDAVASASRSSALGRSEVLRVSTEKTVHVAVDGTVVDVVTAAPTVREALQAAGLVLGEGDHVSVPLDATAVDGLVVLVSRAVEATTTVVEELPFTETVVEDPELTVGERRVDTQGRPGQRQVTYTAASVGGAEVRRTVVAEMVVSEPVHQVVRLGTKPVPPPPVERAAGSTAAAPAGRSGGSGGAPSAPISVDPGSAQDIARGMVAARGWGEDQFSCLVRLWTKESNWRVNADNPSSSAYGIPQALPGSKMASAGADWRTNPATQITWGLGYISGRYGTPCAAWNHSQARNWY